VARPPSEQETGAALARRLRRRWTLLDVGATVVGAFVVFAFLHAVHSAEDPHHPASAALTGSLQLVAFLALTLPLGWAWRRRRTRALWAWLAVERPARPAERDLVLREPLREIPESAVFWGLAVILFGARDLSESARHAFHVMLPIALGGVTTCALIYLLVERLLRPVTARALAHGPPERPVGPGVPTRLITAWALASGVPLLGLALLAVGGVEGDFADFGSLAAAMLVLTAAGLAAGATATVLSARSLSEPLAAVRRALARVRSGDLDVEIPVDDGSEVGLLQAGFNEMAAGLRQRERLRDLFGRHVGEDVARRALADGAALGGELRDVAVLFIDLVGSTALTARRPPEQVVALLNRLFAVVVEVVAACGGWVNRFEGDGALCVFGAPTAQPNAAGAATSAPSDGSSTRSSATRSTRRRGSASSPRRTPHTC
jgi:adenylate cyclase